MRAKESANNLDKSSLKILWITISVSITIGILLRKTGLIISDQYFLIIYNCGIFFVIIGLIIRWISIVKLKKSFTVNVSISKNQSLIQSGLYKYIRHPSYLGSLLSFLGLAFIFNNWLSFILIFFPIFAAFLYRIYIEEKVMGKAFGDAYIDYKKSSWKLLPYFF